MSLLKTFVVAAAATAISITAAFAQQADGSAANPYRVMLVPADGGTEDGTRADFKRQCPNAWCKRPRAEPPA